MKMPRYIITFLATVIFFQIFIVKSLCQEDYHLVKQLNSENGLPSNKVYSVIKDKKGFLWFATDQGVVKYDGKYLKTFTTNDGLSQNDVFDLKEDSKGRIWVFSISTKLCYIKDDAVRVIDSVIDGFDLESFQEDEEGIIFRNYDSLVFEKGDTLSFSDGRDRDYLDYNVKGLSHLIIESHDEQEDLVYLYPTKKRTQRIYAFKKRYLGLFIPGEQRLELIDSKKRKRIIRQFQGKNDQYGLYKLRTYNDHFQLVVNGELWKYFPVEDSLIQIGGRQFKKLDNITSFVQSDDFLTITSLTKGIFLYKKIGQASINENLKGVTNSVILGKNTIIGTGSGGIYAINENAEVVQVIKNTENVFNADIRDIYHDPDEQIIGFASVNMGIVVLKYIGESHHLTFDTLFQDKSKGGLRKLFYKDLLYYAGREGVNRIYLNNKYEATFRTQNAPNDAISTNDSVMWLGQNTQLTRLNLLDNSAKEFPTTYNVEHIKSVKEGLLIGTDGQGVFLFDPDTQTSKSILEGISVTDIAMDSSLVAISSTTGIYLLDSRKKYHLIKHLYLGNGLINNRINNVILLNGRLLSFSENGAQSIDLLETNDSLATKIYLDHPTLNYSLETTLDSSRTLQFTIRSIDFNKRELDYYVSLQKKGKLDNFELSSSPSSRFVGLSPGTHILKIYGQEKYGQLRTEMIERQIFVKHKFYEYLLFQVFLVTLMLLLIGWFFRRRIRKIKEANEEQLNLERTYAGIELQALQSQLNPHFVFNCLGSIQALIKNGESDLANAYLIKFSKLMRMFLEQSSSHITTLENEIEVNRLYLELEKLRFKQNLEYKITIHENVNNLSTPIPAVFVQPFVENAIRHGIFHKEGAGRIELFIYKEAETLKIEITDNGVGIEKSKELYEKANLGHNSKSLAIINRKTELVQAINEFKVDIDTESSSEKGTKITLSIRRA